MRNRLIQAIAASLPALTAIFPQKGAAQAGFEDDRVLLQGFYRESYRHGYPTKFPCYDDKHWYAIVAEQTPAIRAVLLQDAADLAPAQAGCDRRTARIRASVSTSVRADSRRRATSSVSWRCSG